MKTKNISAFNKSYIENRSESRKLLKLLMLLNSSLFLEELEACKLIIKNVRNNNGDLKKKILCWQQRGNRNRVPLKPASLTDITDITSLHNCIPYLVSSDINLGLLLLLSRFSRVRLCATPETAAHQAPPSLGFSRQEYWSGLPFPSPMRESEK